MATTDSGGHFFTGNESVVNLTLGVWKFLKQSKSTPTNTWGISFDKVLK